MNGNGYKQPTNADRLIMVGQYATPEETRIGQQRMATSWPHIRPNSVYVAAVSNGWKKGSWAHVVDMVNHTNKAGICCWFTEMQNRCFNPYDSIGVTRNEIVLKAQNAGFEWILMVDPDVLPKPDTLLRLLQWDMPIVAPYILEPGTKMKLHGPHQDPNTGLRPIRWCVLSMLLFRANVFNCVPGGKFWNDPQGADEGYHFQRLWWYGHRPFIDTNTPVTVVSRPTYPLSTNRMTWDQRQEFWKNKLNSMLIPPDRAPARLGQGPVVDGEYMPFQGAKPRPQPIFTSGGTEPKSLSFAGGTER